MVIRENWMTSACCYQAVYSRRTFIGKQKLQPTQPLLLIWFCSSWSSHCITSYHLQFVFSLGNCWNYLMALAATLLDELAKWFCSVRQSPRKLIATTAKDRWTNEWKNGWVDARIVQHASVGQIDDIGTVEISFELDALDDSIDHIRRAGGYLYLVVWSVSWPHPRSRVAPAVE